MTLVTSTPFLALLVGVVLLGVAYFAVFVPLFGVAPVRKDQLRDLRLLQAGVEQQRASLLNEARAALQLQLDSPGWGARLQALGDHVPEGMWLTRVALEDDQPKGAKRRPAGQAAQSEPPKVYLIVEGMVDARRFPSPLEPISGYLRHLKEDPRIRDMANLDLASSTASKDDPLVVGFLLRGHWRPEATRGKPEERIQAVIKARAVRGPGS